MISGFKTEKNNVIFMLFDIAEQKPEDFLFRIHFIYDNFKKIMPNIESVDAMKKAYYSYPDYEQKIKDFGIIGFFLFN